MFPLQSDGQIHEEPSFFDQDKFLEDLLADSCEVPDIGNEVIRDKGVGKNHKRVGANKDELQSSNEVKKIVHRDIERQRRQEMAGLYASLRSLLPLEYIKGKRSISDHMFQAVNYIKHMEKNIDEMRKKRDKLKKLLNPQSSPVDMYMAVDQKLNTSCSFNSMTINPCRGGMEILISSSPNGGFPLSKVLKELVGRRLNVISCISTRANECFLHKIQIEANDLGNINLIELQEKLVNVIKFS